MFTKQFFVRPLAWAMIVLLAAPPSVMTQQPAAPPAASTQQPAALPTFKQEELDQILAPIALYPDSLVSQILMASTFPLEMVQADRFTKQNASLKGDALTKSLESQSWDPSVKSLVNFPQVLTMMNEKLDWTQKLGDAFLAQQKPVMDTIQSLRAKAQAAGNLKTTQEQTVVVAGKVIIIESAIRRSSMCRPTIPRWCTAPGLIRRIRPITIIRPGTWPRHRHLPLHPVSRSARLGATPGAIATTTAARSN